MSIIINSTIPLSSSSLPNGGLEIVGFKNQVNRLNGSEQGDTITGGNLSDVLSGVAGNDRIQGLAGDDTIFGCDGNDILRGDAGNDSLEGNDGNDILFGGPGADTLIGGDGNDILISGPAPSTAVVLDGGTGQDQLITAGGGNTLTGGSEIDQFRLDLTQKLVNTPDQITDYERGEKIVIKGNAPLETINYDQQTGILSINGQGVAQLSSGLDINLGDIEYIE